MLHLQENRSGLSQTKAMTNKSMANSDWSQQFPRLHELYKLDPSNPKNYFNHPNLKQVLLREPPESSLLVIEQDLQQLDPISWESFKLKIRPYISAEDKYGWPTQFFDLLNEAKGYCYLKDIGCFDITFLAESNKKGDDTPDLSGKHSTGLHLLEVKTIHESDDHNDYLMSRGAYKHNKEMRKAQSSLNSKMKSKLRSTLTKAAQQLNNEAENHPESIHRKIIFLIVWLDLQYTTSGSCSDLSGFLVEVCPPGCEVIHRIANTLFADD